MSETSAPQFQARALAQLIRKWAQRHRMLAGPKLTPEVDESLIRSVFGPVGVPAAVSVLQDRGISYVAYNEEDNSVIIIVQKKPRVRDLAFFSKLGTYGVPISIVAGGVGHAGKLPADPVGDPFIWRQDTYTCGSSVYLSTERGAGTLGCLLKDRDGHIFGLSANHVCGGSNYAELTLPIWAPGQIDIAAGQRDPFVIGNHYSAMPFVDGLPTIVDVNGNIDAAVFLISDPSRVSSFQRNAYDTPAKVGQLRSNLEVMKAGRTTSVTRGKVIGQFSDPEPVIYDIDVVSGRKVIYFKDFFVIKGAAGSTTPFASPGDSGSLIVTTANGDNKEAVGMVVAVGEDGLTLAISLDRILSYFSLEIVSGHNI